MKGTGGISRRTFLRGAGGVALALPFLEIMGCGRSEGALTAAGAARGARALDGYPKRLLVFFSPNGTLRDKWMPTGSETSFQLGPLLAPLDPHKADLLILDGIDALSALNGPGDSHQRGMGQMLTGTELQEGDFQGDAGRTAGWANGISIDQVIARQIGRDTRFQSLELGIYVYGANVGSRMCYAGPAQPLPPENSPYTAFERLFGDFSADPAAQAKRIAQRKSVLDLVSEDFDRLNPRLGTADRRKLDEHLTAVREIESRLQAGSTVGGACSAPTLTPGLDIWKISNIPTVGRLHVDLMAMAFACDLTRVGSIQWTQTANNKPHPWLSVPEGHHDLAHRGDSDLDAQDKLYKINYWYAEEFAYLLQRLKSIPEGDATLLDHTAVVWMREHSKGNDHSRHDVPYIIAGKAGGAFRPGRWLRFGGDVPHNNLHVSLQNAFGVESSTFGNPAYCTGPLSGLS